MALSLHAILGGMCAYQGRGRLEARDEKLGPPYLMAMASTLMVGGPSVAFLFHFYGAWFFHYVFNPSQEELFDRAAFGASVFLMLLLGLATTAGFMGVRHALRKMHPPWSAAPVVVLALLTALLALIFGGRLFFVGDQDQFLTRAMQPIYTHNAGVVSLFPIVSGLVATLQCGRWFKVDNQTRAPV